MSTPADGSPPHAEFLEAPASVPGSILDRFTTGGRAAVNAMPSLLRANQAPAWVDEFWRRYVSELEKAFEVGNARLALSKDALTALVEESILRLQGVYSGVYCSFLDDVHGLLALLTERQSRLLSARWGLLDGPIPTLESLAQGEGVTRERVRQIVVQSEKRLASCWPPLAMLAFTQAAVAQCGMVITAAELMRVLPPCARPSSGLLFRVLDALAEPSGGPHLAQKGGYWLAPGHPGDEDAAASEAMRAVRRAVRRDIARWGAAREEVAAAICEDGVDLAAVTMDRYGDHIALDGWLIPTSRPTSSSLRDALFRLGAVTRRLPFARVQKQLLRRFRTMPPTQVLRAILERQLALSIDDNDCVTLPCSTSTEDLPAGSGEALAARLLTDAGGAMTFIQLQKDFIANGFSAAMANVLASRSVILHRLGPNVLGLVGLPVSAERVRRLRKSAISESTTKLLGFRNGPGSVVHLMYRVNRELLGTSMFRVPVGRVVPGRYQVKNDPRASFVVKKSYLIGPSRYLRHLLANAQSTVTLSFDTSEFTASVSMR